MTLMMTLIAGSGGERHLSAIAARIAGTLGSAADWLAPGIACDIACNDRGAEASARQTIGDAAIDVLVQPAEGRRKAVFIADLESTIIENEMLDELADFIRLR